MRLKNEDELLKPAIRKQIIEEILGGENQARKDEAYKRYQCYKDYTYLYVWQKLLRQFDLETVSEMGYALSNLAIVRKVIDKLARVYKYGVTRKLEDDTDTKKLEDLAKEMNANAMLKKMNRYFKLFKNGIMYIVPKQVDDTSNKKKVKLIPMSPYLYDVIELEDEREKAMALVLSDYRSSYSGLLYTSDPGYAHPNAAVQVAGPKKGNGSDEKIADTPEDQKSAHFVFWSNKYHFTCNERGEILNMDEEVPTPYAAQELSSTSKEIQNAILEMPFVNYAEDQDGAFWAIGGKDLVDGAVLVNSMITNVNHISITQGYGQMVLTGKDPPRSIKVGPNKAVILTHEGEDPVPTFKFEHASPPIEQLIKLVETYLALLLTTNNLSTSGVAANLSGGSAFPSGIAMLIDKSESMEDVEDQRQVFVDNEPDLWRIVAKWQKRLSASSELVEDQSQLMIDPKKFEKLQLKFGVPAPIESEKEKLEVIKTKRDLGLITMVDAIMAENPGMTEDEAKIKLAAILKEKIERMAQAMGDGNEGTEGDNNGIGNISESGSGSGGPDGESEEGSEGGDRGIPGGADSADSGGREESD